MKFSKATKYNSFLKMGLAGYAGSGKTYTALALAQHLSEKRIALIDAELGSASKYASTFDFDVLELTLDDNGQEIDKPFTPQRYMDAIKEAADSGEYDVLIIDGISPEWDDAGGILQMVDDLTKQYKNDGRAAWKVATPLHKKFVNYILRVRMHVIVTMRAKKETVTVKDEHGRAIGKKVALDAVQREDVPYVFDIYGLMQDKELIIEKTRCSELDGQIIAKPGKALADTLREWLKGDPMPERPEYAPEPTTSSPTPGKVQSFADPLTPSQLRKECQDIYGADKWEAVLVRLGLATKSDEDLTPADCKKIGDALATVRAKRQQAA